MSSLSRVLLLATLGALAAGGQVQAQTQSVNAQIEPVRVKYQLPALAAAVVKDGQIVAIGAVGVRILGGTIAVTVDDRFHLGSNTKAMTATLAGTLVDQGRLRWNSSIGEVLGADIPDLNGKLSAVTLEQLLSHTGGIPADNKELVDLYLSTETFGFNPSALRLHALAAWRKNEPEQPPGSAFRYANFGYVIAGAMIEKAAGDSWERLMFTRIFEPLGLRTAGLGPQATFGKFDAAIGHRVDREGKITPIPWGPAADEPPVLSPAGYAHMSILDFATWAGWNAAQGRRGPAIVTAETLRGIHRPHVATPHVANPPYGTPPDSEYALGWGVARFDWTPKPVLFHNGSNSRMLAKILVDPGNDLGIVIMTNFPGQKAETATAEVLERLYGQYGPR
jgi:CubicO group peptidase (beta-lactamase class C family)